MSELESRLVESWQKNAEAWTESVRDKRIESRNLSTNQAIVDEIISLRPRKVLDVGCGEGWLARELHKHGIEVIGFDGSEGLIDKARSLGGGSFHHCSYSDFISDPIRFGMNYDIVVCNFSLLSEDIAALLKSFTGILSNQGRAIIHTLHPYHIAFNDRYVDGWKEETFDGMGEGYTSPMPWYFRTLGSWLDAFHSAGLQLLRCKEPVHPSTAKPLSMLLILKAI